MTAPDNIPDLPLSIPRTVRCAYCERLFVAASLDSVYHQTICARLLTEQLRLAATDSTWRKA